MRRVERVTKHCLKCGREILITLRGSLSGRGRYCSMSCKGMGWDVRNQHNPKWNGGIKIHAYGYRLIASPNHPFKDKQGYVREHRLVMEKHLGRYLKEDELIHHLDHNKLNNKIENLIIISRSEHKKLHPEIGMATRFKKGIINYAS